MNPPIVHFQQPVAAFRQNAIVRGHHQAHSLRRHKVEQQFENLNTGSFIQ
jgi:hypothetical protein